MKKRVFFLLTMIIICAIFFAFGNKILAIGQTLGSSIEIENIENLNKNSAAELAEAFPELDIPYSIELVEESEDA